MSQADIDHRELTPPARRKGRLRLPARAWQLRLLYVGAYTLVFAVIAVVGFASFYRNGRTLVWGLDGMAQHLLGLEYYREYLREIVQSVLSGHPHLPMYDFSIGMGDSVLTGLFSVSYLDVINAFVVFVPKSGVETFYVAAIIIRLYLAGLTFAAFGRYIKAKPWAILLGSVVYVFCGFATFAVPRHPFFGIPLLYVPLLFLGLDLVLRKRSPFVLIGAVFLTALTGFYFLYMITIVMAIYAVVRLGYLNGWRNWRTLLSGVGRTIVSYLIGLALAGAVFLPVVKNFLNSGRTGVSGLATLPLVPTAGDVARSVAYSVAPSPTWNTLGLSGAVLLAVCLLPTTKLPRRTQVHIMAFGGILTIIYLIPLGGLVMNGFSYASQRWSFLLAFFGAALLMYVLPRMVEFTSWRYLAICAGAVTCYAIGWAAFGARFSSRSTFVLGVSTATLIALLAALAVAHAAQRKGNRHLARAGTALFAGLTCLSVLANVVLVYSGGGYRYASAFASQGEADRQYSQAISPGVAIAEADRSTYRIDNNVGRLPNAAMLGNYNSVSSYWSQSNGQYLQGLRDLELATMNLAFSVRGLNSRASLEALAGVKYKVQNSDGRVSALGYQPDTAIQSPVRGKSILRNGNALPFGYVYAKSVPAAEWQQLSAIDKQEAMLQAAVVQAPGATSHTNELTYTSVKLPMSTSARGATWRDGLLHVTKKSGGLRLEFNSPAGCETYVRLVGFGLTSPGQAVVRVSSGGSSQSVKYFSDDSSYYYPRPSVLANLGYSNGQRKKANVTLPTKGTFRLESVEVYAYPLDRLASQVKDLDREGMKDAAVAGNTLTGHVTASRPGTLVLSVPFDKGWTVSVDGQAADTFLANGLYTGLRLDAGTHQIRATYVTPWLHLGLATSGVGLAALAALWTSRFRRRRSQTVQ